MRAKKLAGRRRPGLVAGGERRVPGAAIGLVRADLVLFELAQLVDGSQGQWGLLIAIRLLSMR